MVTPGGRWAGVLVLPSVDSTNAEAVRLDRQWYAVIADHQESGRGRLGRAWQDVPRASLACSVTLPVPEHAPGWVPLVTALAVRGAIQDVAGVGTLVKWPNDVLVPADGGRKVCGILCELTARGIVVGTGINVDQEREELPVETATSLRLAGAPDVSREALAAAYLLGLEQLHRGLCRGGRERERIQDEYRAACATIGAEVDLDLRAGARERGQAVGVDPEGRLIVERRGRLDTVAAGDVTHVRLP